MSDKLQEQKDYAEIYGAMTFINLIIQQFNNESMRNTPGMALLLDILRDNYNELQAKIFKDFTESLFKANEEDEE